MSAGRKINTKSQHYGTPQKYIDSVKEVFNGSIYLDPCSNKHSLVDATVNYIYPLQDGLKDKWSNKGTFVNPPYGRDVSHGTSIKDWLKKCSEYENVIALVPVATNTSHWKEYIFPKADVICFLYDTRVKFLIEGKEEGKGSPMACAMIYYGPKDDSRPHQITRFKLAFFKHGFCWEIR